MCDHNDEILSLLMSCYHEIYPGTCARCGKPNSAPMEEMAICDECKKAIRVEIEKEG